MKFTKKGGRAIIKIRQGSEEPVYAYADRIKTLALGKVPHELSNHYAFIRARARLHRHIQAPQTPAGS